MARSIIQKYNFPHRVGRFKTGTIHNSLSEFMLNVSLKIARFNNINYLGLRKIYFNSKLVFYTFNYNFDSGRVQTQKVPRLASVQASITELNAGKRQHSCHCVIEAIVKLLIVFVPRDLWFRVTLGRAGKRDIASFIRRKAGWRPLSDFWNI